MSLLKIYQGPILRALLDEIHSPVEVIYQALEQPEPETMAALKDLMALTLHLSVTTRPAAPEAEADRVIVQGVKGQALVFIGPPLGTELAALVSAIVVAGRGDSGLSAPTRQALAALTGPVHLEVFTAPT
jgi:alkyl hydroperoxide reductase subunit AhpF